MKILIDVGHPAQVHYYSALYKFLKDDHSFIFTCRDQQIVADLLKYYGIPYIVIREKSLCHQLMRISTWYCISVF